VLWTAFPGIQPQWQQIVIFLSIASMLLGSFAAIGQTSIKRLLAYSSIANVGFALVGLSAGTEQGVWSVLVYLGIYLIMTLGAFACVIAMRRESGPVESIDDLAGLNETHLGMAAAFAALMFSLAGIPPLAGFFAKLYVLKAAMDAGLYPLAIIGVLASVVGAYYYLRVIKVMFFDAAKEPLLPVERGVGIVMAVSAAMVVLYVVFGSSLEAPALAAAKSLRF
jgi:NADH-quinone oxidoreductase subunit N